MVKHFSVDWMAQSSSPSERADMESMDETSPVRPHVRCMVQPLQPSSYGRDYLQPKAKAFTPDYLQPKPQACTPDYLQPKPQACTPARRTAASPARSTSCGSPRSVSEISGYSSGYESEAGLSECPSVGSPVPVSEADREEDEANRDGSDRDGALQQRRLRTKFTPEQITKLEKIFQKHKYLDAGERLKSAQKLNLSETQIRTWFQNRRMKLKREVQDMRAEAYFAPALNQYHDFAGQRLQYPHQHPALGVGYPSMYPSVGYPSMGPPIMGPSMGQQLQGPQPTVSYHMAPRFY